MKVDEKYPDGRTLLYGGVGAGVAIPHPVTQLLDAPVQGGYQWGGLCWHVLAGVEYRLNPKFGLSLQYKHTSYRHSADMAEGATGSTRLSPQALFIGTTIRP